MESENPRPNFIIVGCQKSGTTWTHMALAKHPDVFTSNPKELHFFNRQQHRLQSGFDEYLSHFEGATEKVIMESTPGYFQGVLPKTDPAQNIQDFLGDQVKLLVIFRNPVERAVSAIIHHMLLDTIPIKNVLDEIPQGLKIKELGMYSEILRHWQAVFGDRLIIRFYDEIKSDPKQYIDSICDALEIPPSLSEAQIDFKANHRKGRAESKNIEVLPQCSPALLDELLDLYKPTIHELFEMCQVSLDDWLDRDKLLQVVNS